MTRIDGEIFIARPPEVVFACVGDQRNEPNYNPRMVRAEKLTAGPVGVGTRFAATMTAGRRRADMVIEVTEYDRPNRSARGRRPQWRTSTERSASSRRPAGPGCGGRGRCGPKAPPGSPGPSSP